MAPTTATATFTRVWLREWTAAERIVSSTGTGAPSTNAGRVRETAIQMINARGTWYVALTTVLRTLAMM